MNKKSMFTKEIYAEKKEKEKDEPSLPMNKKRVNRINKNKTDLQLVLLVAVGKKGAVRHHIVGRRSRVAVSQWKYILTKSNNHSSKYLKSSQNQRKERHTTYLEKE